MIRRFPFSACLLTASLLLTPFASLAKPISSSTNLKVLAQEGSGLNVSLVESLLKRGDDSVAKGDLKKARKHYDQARKVSRELLSFYRDLSGAFRGLDARIPREMDAKGRQTLKLLAQVNLRLAAVFRRLDQPEVAVPVLVEVVRLMTPAKPEGQKAYQGLLELGFVETPYAAARQNKS